MHRINGYLLYFLGTSLGALSVRLEAPNSYRALAQQVGWSASALRFFAGTQEWTLKGSQSAAAPLADRLSQWIDPAFLQQSGHVIIPDQERNITLSMINNLGVILASELGHANTYSISRLRAWDVNILIDSADGVLSERSRDQLPNQVKSDLREAGRCLAFDVPTAAGFHVFRAVEATTFLYFDIFQVPIPTKPSQRNLGRYMDVLSAEGLSVKIMEMLKHLKDYYRNPLMHPEITLTLDEASDVFTFAQSAISRMLADQEDERGKRGTTSALSVAPPSS